MQFTVEKKLLLFASVVATSAAVMLIGYAKTGLSPDVTYLVEKTAAIDGDPQKTVQLRQEFDSKLLQGIALLTIGIFGVAGGCGYLLVNNAKAEPGERVKETKKTDEKIESAGVQAESNHKQWMADTSHELRTPIAILRAQVEAFQDGVQEVTPKTLQVLHSEIMGLSKLVDDLHWLSNLDVGNLKHSFVPVEVVSTLQDVADIFEERFGEKEIVLDTSGITGETGTVYADNNRMRQVFMNLLENSLRYTDCGGKIKLSVEKSPSAIVLQFDDSNPGVPEEMLPKIFDRFFRVEPSRSRELGGSGLGLAICKTIIEAHSGTISASKSELGGIKVQIVLPTARSLRGG
jgi:two-component system sensor histidine kinase BaeS